MTNDVELKRGHGDGLRFAIEGHSTAPAWPPQAIYLPRDGGPHPSPAAGGEGPDRGERARGLPLRRADAMTGWVGGGNISAPH
jgi:hypothetical protein